MVCYLCIEKVECDHLYWKRGLREGRRCKGIEKWLQCFLPVTLGSGSLSSFIPHIAYWPWVRYESKDRRCRLRKDTGPVLRELIVSSQKIGMSSPNISGTRHPFAEHTAASLVFFPFVQHPGLDQPPGGWFLHTLKSQVMSCVFHGPPCHSVQSPRQPSMIRNALYLLSFVALLVWNELVPVFSPSCISSPLEHAFYGKANLTFLVYHCIRRNTFLLNEWIDRYTTW